jgi:signal transduction histidine kinase/CheY-like chemotaxis protein
MDARLFTIAVERDTDILLARERTRKIAALVGFDGQDQNRITTAVSEIVRNALEYGGGGRVEYRLFGEKPAQTLAISVQDRGPGMTNVDAVLAGTHRSTTGMGVGILGARRLMDRFDIQTAPGKGTTVILEKVLSPRAKAVMSSDLRDLTEALTKQEGLDPLSEIRRQNQEMVVQLEELNQRQQELFELNLELQDTNRGVVALYAELEDRADHLRRADQLKSRFLSNMSHEFRTPLNSILSLSRLLLSRSDGPLTPEQERQVQFVRKAAENLTELVNDLLDLARVEAGKTVITPAEFSIADLFSTLRGMLRPLLPGDAVALIFEEAGDLPNVISDEGKVSQILRNFISNALKFTQRGEVRIWAEHDKAEDTITFRVRDTGIGIEPKDIEVIWQEFGQIPSALQGRVKGTGLGLPLSKKLAELLLGGVDVVSAAGEGSVFSLTVPRIYRSSDPAEAEEEWMVDPDRLHILVVEDNPADSFSAQRALAQSRYQVIPVRSIAEAKRVMERVEPAAILLDVMLQGEECWRLLIELKQNERTHSIPVVIISTTQEERKARSFGADDYMDKPLDPKRLVKTLDELTGANSVTKVLLVDDEEISRYLIRQLLPRGVFDVREAATASDGLAAAARDAPDVILLDLSMPDFDGFEFLERLSATQKLAAPPAVIVTSMLLDNQQRRRLDKAAGIVSKIDLNSDTLVAAIRRAVEAAP